MLSPTLVIGTSLAYLLLLFAVAAWGDRRAAQGREGLAVRVRRADGKS